MLARPKACYASRTVCCKEMLFRLFRPTLFRRTLDDFCFRGKISALIFHSSWGCGNRRLPWFQRA
jgi:hypothetical protein